MKNEKNKVTTPNPPQEIDPSKRREPEEKDVPGTDQPANRSDKKKGPAKDEQHHHEKEEKPKLLGESETEIDDETTI